MADALATPHRTLVRPRTGAPTIPTPAPGPLDHLADRLRRAGLAEDLIPQALRAMAAAGLVAPAVAGLEQHPPRRGSGEALGGRLAARIRAAEKAVEAANKTARKLDAARVVLVNKLRAIDAELATARADKARADADLGTLLDQIPQHVLTPSAFAPGIASALSAVAQATARHTNTAGATT